MIYLPTYIIQSNFPSGDTWITPWYFDMFFAGDFAVAKWIIKPKKGYSLLTK